MIGSAIVMAIVILGFFKIIHNQYLEYKSEQNNS